jgi:hypothetical protein
MYDSTVIEKSDITLLLLGVCRMDDKCARCVGSRATISIVQEAAVETKEHR